MNKGKLTNTLIILVLSGMLTFLYLKTRELDANLNYEINTHIQDLLYRDSLLNQSILELSTDQFANYDRLKVQKNAVEQNLEWFNDRVSDVEASSRSELLQSLENTDEVFRSKFELIERFKSYNGVLKNSLYYVPTAAKNAIQHDLLGQYERQVNALLLNTLFFNSRPDNQYKNQAKLLIEKFKKRQSRPYLELAVHSELVINNREKLQSVIDSIFSLPVKEEITEVYKDYSDGISKIERNNLLFRTAMYVIALLLVAYVVHLFLTLRRTMSRLEDSLNEIAFQNKALDEHTIVVTLNPDKTIRSANEKFWNISGYSKNEAVGTAAKLLDDSYHSHESLEKIWNLSKEGTGWRGETRCKKNGGGFYWTETAIVPFIDTSGNPTRYVALMNDISAKKDAQIKDLAVERELKLAASVFSESPIAIVITNYSGQILRVNESFSRICGYSPESAIGQNIQLIRSSHHDKSFYTRILKSLEETGHWEGEIWYCRHNNEEFPVWCNIAMVQNETHEVSHFINLFSDITEKKQVEDRVYQLAHFDTLTDLPNRAMFVDQLNYSLENARQNNTKVAVLFLDLDKFKLVNDSLGHACGDELLKYVADHLQLQIRQKDIVSRLGGDEFTVGLVDVKFHHEIVEIVERILSMVDLPVHLEGKDIVVSTSIGISVFPDDATDVGTLLKNSDLAMYKAKSAGTNQYAMYSEELKQENTERHSLENDLQLAVRGEQFELFYQPLIGAKSGSISAVESLIRWNHPEKGLILPMDFIPALEESGLIVSVGRWVISEACRQLSDWKANGYSLRMSINLSACQLEDENLQTFILQTLKSNNLEPNELVLELTESTLLQNTDVSIPCLNAISDIGVGLSLDDFGTGYSSLSYLKKLPFDALKIDRSFIMDLPQDSHDLEMVNTILAMAKNLNLKVVAEGVETAEQYALLRGNGCDYLQGYLFSKPVNAAELGKQLSQDQSGTTDGEDFRQTG